MALLNSGFYIARGNISTNTETQVVTPQGTAERPEKGIYVLWITLGVTTAGTTSRVKIEAGTAGSGVIIAGLATTTADAILNLNYTTTYRDYPGNFMTGININTSGGAAATIYYEIAYQVK